MRALPIVLSLILAGCGAFVPVADTRNIMPEKKHAMNSVRILNAAQLQGVTFEVITFIEGNSCKNMMTDPAPTRAAVDQLKFYAADTGANAISNIQCAGREGTSYSTNCWELISCTAEAIKLPANQ